MYIGSAIALFVIGAILTYGVEADIAGLNLVVIGQILMVAGVVGGVIGLLMTMSTRRRRVSTQEVHRTPTGEVVYTEHDV
jgi:beta-lactamase regulating signal transducer with metallopeptidase domain